MQDSNLDEISGIFDPKGLFNVSGHIAAAQEKYIESRIKWFWKLGPLKLFSASKVKLLFTEPEVEWGSEENEKFVKVAFKRKLILAGNSYFWSWLLLKRRK